MAADTGTEDHWLGLWTTDWSRGTNLMCSGDFFLLLNINMYQSLAISFFFLFYYLYIYIFIYNANYVNKRNIFKKIDLHAKLHVMQGHQAPWFLSHRQSPWCAALSWRNSYGKQANTLPALTKKTKKKKQVFGFTFFPANRTIAEKRRGTKLRVSRYFYITHDGSNYGQRRTKWLTFTNSNKKHSTRTKNLSYNQYTYIVTSHAACSSLFNSVGREEWINPDSWQIDLYKGTGGPWRLYTYCSCCSWWNSTLWMTCFSNYRKQEIEVLCSCYMY